VTTSEARLAYCSGKDAFRKQCNLFAIYAHQTTYEHILYIINAPRSWVKRFIATSPSNNQRSTKAIRNDIPLENDRIEPYTRGIYSLRMDSLLYEHTRSKINAHRRWPLVCTRALGRLHSSSFAGRKYSTHPYCNTLQEQFQLSNVRFDINQIMMSEYFVLGVCSPCSPYLGSAGICQMSIFLSPRMGQTSIMFILCRNTSWDQNS
jgi:hypothetical protein